MGIKLRHKIQEGKVGTSELVAVYMRQLVVSRVTI